MPATQTVERSSGVEPGCQPCADRLVTELQRHPGIRSVSPAPGEGSLRVTYDPAACSPRCLDETIDVLRADLEQRYRHQELRIGGMDCADCARTITRAVERIDGISHVDVSFAAERVRLEYRPGSIDMDQVAERVRGLGYEVSGTATAVTAASGSWWRRREALTGAAAALLTVAVAIDLAGGSAFASSAVYAVAILTGGLPVARSGFNALRATRRPDINLLMAIAVIGATAIGAWLEGALVVVLFSIGELLERRAADRARRELAALVSLAPDVARVRRGTSDAMQEVEVPVAELTIGEQVVVRPGERIAVDGVIREGASAVDQASITGESTPVDRSVGESVFAGTLNGEGMLVVQVDAAPGDSTLDKIARLVVEAQAARSPSERWVDRFANLYTPLVIAAAILVALAGPHFGASWSASFYSALALLILACPCALVISTPVSIVSSLARASAAGVLIKGGAHLEQAAAIRTVAFDKTGTLTYGRPRLASMQALRGDEDTLLTLAASLEQGSEHPLARAILAAATKRGLKLRPIEDFQALTGLGARARVDGTDVAVGSPRMFDDVIRREPAACAALKRTEAKGATAVLVACDDEPVGVLGLADEPREEAAQAIADLRRLGIEHTVMLTGDNACAAQAIGESLGVSEIRAELMPADKSHAVAGLGHGVAMVGDGVNDAPALAASDLAIAMGSAGSDAAIEVADIALMGDDPRKVAGLIGTARWTRTVVRQNIAFSLATKLAAVIVLAFGALPLWGAVLTDVGASLLVVANGLRLLRGRPLGPSRRLPLLHPAITRAAPGSAHGDDHRTTTNDEPVACCEEKGSA